MARTTIIKERMEITRGVSRAAVILGLSLILLWQTASGQQFTTSPQRTEVMEGSNVSLRCHVTDLGNSSVFWIHNGTILTQNQLVLNNQQHYVMLGRYNLMLINVTSQDEGEYRCQVSSSPAINQVSTVIITVPAEIKEFPEPTEVVKTLGESVSFTCGASGKPTPEVTWTHDGNEVVDDEDESRDTREMTTTVLRKSSLLLKNIKPHLAGVYTCTAYNGAGTADKSSVRLKILYPPTILNKTTVIHTGPGREAYLPCIVSAQPEPLVSWLHNGSRLGLRDLPQHKEIAEEELDGAKNYRLRIKEVAESDFGVYVCSVTNSKGEDRVEMTLTAAPSKPVILTDSKANYSDHYSLKWSVISYVTPLDYDVMIREADNTTAGTDWEEINVKPSPGGQGSEVHEVSLNIPDLSHTTSYEVIIKAHNSYGWSQESDPFMFTTNKAGVTAPPTTLPPSTSPTVGNNSDANGSASLVKFNFSLWFCVLYLTLAATLTL